MILPRLSRLACRRYAGLLVPFNERTLPGPERSVVAAHLRVCPFCRDEAAALARISDMLHANPPTASHSDLWGSLEAQIRATPQESSLPISFSSYPTRRGLGLRASYAGIVAATLVLGAVLYRHPTTPETVASVSASPKPRNRVALLTENQLQSPRVLKTEEAALVSVAPPVPRLAEVHAPSPQRLRDDIAGGRIATLKRGEARVSLPKPAAVKSITSPSLPHIKMQGIEVALLSTNAAETMQDWQAPVSEGSQLPSREIAKPETVSSTAAETESASAPAIQRTVPATSALVSTASEQSERQRALFSYTGW